MSNRLSFLAWVTVPFLVTLVVLIVFRWGHSSDRVVTYSVPDASELVGLALKEDGLVDARTVTSTTDDDWSVPDTAAVVLLGGIGCSGNQVDVLRYWSTADSNRSMENYPVFAVYADPSLGLDQGIHESRALRRVSQAEFPFFVSQDTLLNPRLLGIRTPQVVLIEAGVITHVLDLPAAYQPGGLIRSAPGKETSSI